MVEQVRDGSTLRVLLLPSFSSVLVVLSGIKVAPSHINAYLHCSHYTWQAPGFKRSEDGKTETPEPFAAEAKYFTETRLLNRDVKVVLEGEAI